MKLEAFSHSEPLTLGVELELQLVNTHDYDLAPYAEDMLRLNVGLEDVDDVIEDLDRALGKIGL